MANHADGLAYEFDPPDKGPGPAEPHLFEIGLVLGGAVSASAYMAGVIDFLIEALDAWELAKAAAHAQHPGTDTESRLAWDVPSHDVRIPVMAGASGGGMTAAMTAAVLTRDIQHVRAADAVRPAGAQGADTGNPLFNSWVNDIDILDLLGRADLDRTPGQIRSILDSSKLPDIAAKMLDTAGRLGSAAEKGKARASFANPLRVYLTQTNLHGVQYGFHLTGQAGNGHTMALHRDHLRYAVHAGRPAGGGPTYADERPLPGPPSSLDGDWWHLGYAALACGAFPLALAPRAVKRPYADYQHRVTMPTGAGVGPFVESFPPLALPAAPDGYSYVGVDGGCMNNEPIDLVRDALWGTCHRPATGARTAWRASILIDAFPAAPTPGPAVEEGINPFSALFALIDAWTQQSRFKPEELYFAQDEEDYTRFIIAPSRGGASPSLASAALGAFAGFLARGFRVHDYLLGRRNAQQFLRQHFALPEDHGLFDCWAPAVKDRYRLRHPAGHPTAPGGVIWYDEAAEVGFLPIIPLIAGHPVSQEEPKPDWPAGQCDVAAVVEGVGRRFDELFATVTDMAGLGFFEKTYLGPLRRTARGKLTDFAEGSITKALRKSGL